MWDGGADQGKGDRNLVALGDILELRSERCPFVRFLSASWEGER